MACHERLFAASCVWDLSCCGHCGPLQMRLEKLLTKQLIENGVLKTFAVLIQNNLPSDLFDLYSNKLLQAKYTVSVF